MTAPAPEPPRYAVIFTAQRTSGHAAEYAAMADRMEELARRQPGFLGVESARGPDGAGITVSYWSSLEAVHAWGRQAEHLAAQRLGRERWYQWFRLRIARVESSREYAVEIDSPST